MREIGFTNRTDLGYSFLSDWGLFETLGQTPPRSLDAAYRLDYFEERGPGFGVDAAYGGGFVTEESRQPWNFKGDLKSYFINDIGTDATGSGWLATTRATAYSRTGSAMGTPLATLNISGSDRSPTTFETEGAASSVW